MAVLQINTQSAQYQQKLSELNTIINFYKPVVRRYVQMDPEIQADWRQRDPILNRLVQIHEAIARFETEDAL